MEQERDLISIGSFARLTGLSVGALRHYARHAVLTPAHVRPDTGYRSYAREQVETGRLVARLRELEMSLPQVRAVLAADEPARRNLVARHRARIRARADRLHRIIHQLHQEDFMTAPTADPIDADTHRQLGTALFNQVWQLLEAEDRSQEQDDEMVHAAHASRLHWSRSGVPDLRQRLAVGEWQCSRVYAVLGRAEPALHHARRCLAMADAGGLEDWVLASAREAMARASLAAGDRSAYAEWRARAEEATAAIADDEEREVIEGDLATLA